jgi:penicillin-binding protein-related factor A (putative recombinase)
MLEANFQTLFSRWAKYNIDKSMAFELKLEKGKSLPFSAVMEHQLIALKLAKHGKLIHKIADGIAGGQKPFDCFTLAGVPAYVVIMFYRRAQKEFYMIDVDVFINEKETSDRKSLTDQRAKEIGITCLLR